MKIQTYALACGLLASFVPAGAQEATTRKADNTAVNKRDRKSTEPTADQQKENTSDRQIAKNIRRAIVSDKSLSTYAHNVKVIVMNGTVTLKGPVRSAEEKMSVAAKAAEVAGAGKVTNEISIAGDDADRKKSGSGGAMKQKTPKDQEK